MIFAVLDVLITAYCRPLSFFLVLDLANNLCEKFEVPSFTRSGDKMG